jgi:hypothetical protein
MLLLVHWKSLQRVKSCSLTLFYVRVKPIGALNPTRLEKYLERYESFEDAIIPKFHYDSHYLSASGVR